MKSSEITVQYKEIYYILPFSGVFSRGQDFEVPPSSFFDRFSSKALTEYFDNSLPKSAGGRYPYATLLQIYNKLLTSAFFRLKKSILKIMMFMILGNNNAIQLSSLPNLSREDIIPSKNLFAKEVTARRTTTSDESLTLQHPYTTQGIMKPEVHTSTAVVQSSTLNSTPNIPTSTTITEILHTSTIQITKSTSMSTETAGTTPVEHLISSTISANIESPKSSTTTEKPRNSRIKIDLTSRKGMKKECDKKKNYFFETSSHLPQKFKDNSTTTESTTRYHVSTSTTVFPIFPTTLKRRIFHTPSLRIIPHRKIPEVISRVSTSSPKFSFAFNVKQTPISNLMKNSELPLVAIGKKFYHVQTEIKVSYGI